MRAGVSNLLSARQMAMQATLEQNKKTNLLKASDSQSSIGELDVFFQKIALRIFYDCVWSWKLSWKLIMRQFFYYFVVFNCVKVTELVLIMQKWG